MSEEQIELALLTGERRADLERMFGVGDYAELRDLAASSAQVRLRSAPRVLILPGILGSKLGKRRRFIKTWDTLWLDFGEIIFGNLTGLSLKDQDPRIQSFSVILSYYLKLKYRLRRAGFRPKFHHYDWRLSIDILGQELATTIKEQGEPVSLVAHSMGGLVSRAAFAQLGNETNTIKDLVMLGTPNHGSFLPVQAFRGTAATLKKLATLDITHSSETLVDEVFSTFDGLIQMLPFGGQLSTIDFFQESTWPAGKFRPKMARLKKAPRVHELLAQVRPDDLARMHLIAGVNCETAVDATFNSANSEFEYRFSQEGDGTVPLESARLPGIKQVYYVEEEHGALPNNRRVAESVIDILRTGSTEKLPTEWSPTMGRSIRLRSESQLREASIDLEPGREPALEEERDFLREFLAQARQENRETAIPDLPALDDLSRQPIVIGRRRQHRLDVTLARGSVTEVNSQAIILGVFAGVAPSGAARALDEALGGEITRLVNRRVFSTNTGEVFILPVSRRQLKADFVVFVGLGYYDEFSEEVLELASQNVARMLLAAQIGEFATVMMGSASATSMTASLRSMLRGFSAGVVDQSSGHMIRSVTIVESDERRFQQMTRSLVELAVSDILDGIEITIESIQLPDPIMPSRLSRSSARTTDPLYLIVRQEAQAQDHDLNFNLGGNDQSFTLHSSLLTSGGKATVVSESLDVPVDKLNTLLERLGNMSEASELNQVGRDLANLVLPPQVAELMLRMQSEARPVVVLHDAEASRIPWEILQISDPHSDATPDEEDYYIPALSSGLSRRLVTDVPIAKWLEQRMVTKQLDILLVVDPTSDLAGARREGKRIQKSLEQVAGVTLEVLYQKEATRARLNEEFRSGKYDVIHYAGHAFFDPMQRSRSGLLCSDKRVLSGEDLAGIGNLPALMVFNACEAGRVRGAARSAMATMEAQEGSERVLRNVSLSEAFLRGGVANYIGTYWPVGDEAAEQFATTFYGNLIKGVTIGEALNQGRQAVHKVPSIDWADYMHYGDLSFRLKAGDTL